MTLAQRLSTVEARVRRAVDAMRAGDPNPDDPYRGLYLTPETIDALLTGPARQALPDEAGPAPEVAALTALAKAFGLSELDVEVLLIAMAPDLDPRFERFYGYLNDDVTRRRPTIGLALELCGVAPADPAGRARFGAGAPLVAHGLLTVTEPERPLLSRTIGLPDRVTAHLLGDQAPDAALAGIATVAEESVVDTEQAARLGRGLAAGLSPVHLVQRAGAAAPELAVAALAAAGRPAVLVDAAALADGEPGEVVAIALREAGLRGGGLVLGPLEALPDRGRRRLLGLLTGPGPAPVLLYGNRQWQTEPGRPGPVSIPVTPARAPDRVDAWQAAVGEHSVSTPDDAVIASALAPYRLGAGQLAAAARAAAGLAVLDGGELTAHHLRAGVRAQNGSGLARLARRVEPAVGWADLVLPAAHRAQLGEMVQRARHRDLVLRQWRMRPGGGRGAGVLALFAGESGTGKTMSAEVVAGELGLDLYVVDLATVVDKYIGETEKNLDRIFTEAAGVNGLLLFDEADALFGKRTEVKDSHDRNANMESAFLLQRMESFDGIAVLTTNLRANLDEAFTRRIDVIVDFPVPEAGQRLALWESCLGAELPRASDVDLEFCANSFELAGGSIRACAVTAAYLAAEADRPVAMADLIAAIRGEYRKLGRLVLRSEFGDWLAEG
ncbi:ATP-binding protein [Amycolatopsis minnesotensis]|uniref:ATP-binding protein n=1 Tax=Amycolatopsis minnesotensis TaxID=337894 RepID=A0ABP5BQE7_9PSEU